MSRPLAVFDVDGTVFRSSLLIELVEVLIEQGLFPEKVRSDFESEHTKWLDRKGDYESYITAVIKVFLKNIKGIYYGDFVTASEIVIKRHKDHLYMYTRDLITELKQQGYFVVAISQSPKGVLDQFCKRLGFDKVYGRFYELGPSDRFTGNVTDEHLIENKANIVRRVIDKENLNLKKSVAVGDTEGDIPMLEMVEQPIAFNPNEKLYRHAKINDWKIVVERKDVVYEIN